jgi:hypothetical protein
MLCNLTQTKMVRIQTPTTQRIERRKVRYREPPSQDDRDDEKFASLTIVASYTLRKSAIWFRATPMEDRPIYPMADPAPQVSIRE